MSNEWNTGMTAAGLCPLCTDWLPDDGVCRRCNGCDIGTRQPAEIDETWERDQWTNGVVWYSKGDVHWTCDLAGKWFRFPKSASGTP